MQSDSGIVNLLVLSAHEALDEGVVMGDGDGVLQFNDAACRLYGRSREELMAAESVFGLLGPEEQARLEALVADRVQNGVPEPKRFETVLVWPDGTEVQVEMSTTAIVQGAKLRTLTLIRDIGDRRRHQAELERLALHDPLTGLPNRTLLMERLGRIAARAEREAVMAAIFFLDLDGFKSVNDVHGHEAGDRVLVGIARALSESLRGGDSAARLGGDEFVVVCEQIPDDAAAEQLAARLAEVVAQPISLERGGEISMGVSIGIRRFGAAPIDPQEILRGADAAMYRAKTACADPS